MEGSTIVERYASASAETRYLVDRLLAADADDRAWARQLGPVYRQADVARLLRKSKQAVSSDPHLIKLEMRRGDVGYPVFQFDGPRLLAGIREVGGILRPAVETEWTVASWLTSPQPDLNGRRPLNLLRERQMEEVLAAARRAARSLAA
ncbi:MAG: antitoxin Xre/MbcA/ParS toxin-binding domain-containing protein [Nitriliruptorales bacterium]